MKILVINGPNLDMLGMRDPEKYGSLSLEDINRELKRIAESNGYKVVFFQSNSEGELISRIHRVYFDETAGILINAAAYTHTSVGILDALTIKGDDSPFPFVEVHLSDPKKREPFRHHSFLEAKAITTVSGMKADSYYEGLKRLMAYLSLKADEKK